jgi:cell division protein FtsI (penicillin-binding protein 3)
MKPITVAIAIDAASSPIWRRAIRRAPRKSRPSPCMTQARRQPQHPEALIHSSNIVLAQVGDQMGAQRMMTFHALGFAERPISNCPRAACPLAAGSARLWTRVSTTTVPMAMVLDHPAASGLRLCGDGTAASGARPRC